MTFNIMNILQIWQTCTTQHVYEIFYGQPNVQSTSKYFNRYLFTCKLKIFCLPYIGMHRYINFQILQGYDQYE